MMSCLLSFPYPPSQLVYTFATLVGLLLLLLCRFSVFRNFCHGTIVFRQPWLMVCPCQDDGESPEATKAAGQAIDDTM